MQSYMFLNRCFVVCCKSVNQLFSSFPSIEIQHYVSYKAKFVAALRLWRKREEEKKVREIFFVLLFIFANDGAGKLTVMSDYTQMLLKKVAQLEEAWTQKDKFIHSSRMIVRFREDHISRLEKQLKEGQGFLSDNESRALIDQLKEEIKILRDQVQNLIPFEHCITH